MIETPEMYEHESDDPTAKVEGGHCIMLRVDLSVAPQIKGIAETWVNQRPVTRKMKFDQHLTVIFVGKNLLRGTHQALLETGQALERIAPRHIRLTELGAYGYHKDHLAVRVEQNAVLLSAERITLETLGRKGISVKRDFGGFDPHITMAVGGKRDQMPPPCLTLPDDLLIPVVAVQVKLGSGNVKEFPLTCTCAVSVARGGPNCASCGNPFPRAPAGHGGGMAGHDDD